MNITKSKNQKVQEFLEDIMMINEEQYNILQKLREIVFKLHPKIEEKMKYGGIMFSLEEDLGGLFVQKKHISFEFVNGFQFNDPDILLEGTGKYRRHLKLRSISDIDDKNVKKYVKQIWKFI